MRFSVPFLLALGVFVATVYGANITSFGPQTFGDWDITGAIASFAFRFERTFGIQNHASFWFGAIALAAPAIIVFHAARMVTGGSVTRLLAENATTVQGVTAGRPLIIDALLVRDERERTTLAQERMGVDTTLVRQTGRAGDQQNGGDAALAPAQTGQTGPDAYQQTGAPTQPTQPAPANTQTLPLGTGAPAQPQWGQPADGFVGQQSGSPAGQQSANPQAMPMSQGADASGFQRTTQPLPPAGQPFGTGASSAPQGNSGQMSPGQPNPAVGASDGLVQQPANTAASDLGSGPLYGNGPGQAANTADAARGSRFEQLLARRPNLGALGRQASAIRARVAGQAKTPSGPATGGAGAAASDQSGSSSVPSVGPASSGTTSGQG